MFEAWSLLCSMFCCKSLMICYVVLMLCEYGLKSYCCCYIILSLVDDIKLGWSGFNVTCDDNMSYYEFGLKITMKNGWKPELTGLIRIKNIIDLNQEVEFYKKAILTNLIRIREMHYDMWFESGPSS